MNKKLKAGYGIVLSLAIIFNISCSNGKNGKTVTASGAIEAIDVDVPVKSGGQIMEIRFEEGQKVAKGDTLAVIDNEQSGYQLSAAEAALSGAKAQYKLLLSGARSEDIVSAEENLKTAAADLNAVKADYDRIQSLYHSGSATAKQLQDMETRYTASQARVKTAEEQLHKIKNIARPEELEAAKAQVKRTEAEGNLLRKRLEDCYITAPVAGVATLSPFEVGELAGIGATIARIVNIDTLELKIYITEDELGLVKLGQKAEIVTDTYKDRVFNGYVVYISPEAEFTPKNIQTKEDRVKLVFMVKLNLLNEEQILKPGMQADAKLITE